MTTQKTATSLDSSRVVRDIHISTVKPARASEHPASFDPTFFDLAHMDAVIPVLFVYRLPVNTDEGFSQLVHTMKKSLSETLVDFYPFAGRWVRTMDAKMRRLVCNDSGVPFIEAFVDDDLEHAVSFRDYQPVRCLTGFDLMGFDPDKFNQNSAPELVTLFVQVTRFKCGGVTLVSSFNHMTADGHGFFSFMKAWGELARNGRSAVIPDHRRSLAKSYEASIPGFLEADILTDAVTRLTTEAPKIYCGEDKGEMFKIPPSRSVPTFIKSFHVRKDLVDEIKREAIASDAGDYVTTLDCISAHFRKHWAKFAKSKNRAEHIVTAVNGRNRFYEEELPPGFLSNCLFALVIPPPEEPTSLLTSARTVRKLVRSVSPTTWRGEGPRGPEDFSLDPGFIISSWSGFPMYEVDFGFGKPLLCSYAAHCNFHPSGICLVLPPIPQHSSNSIATVSIMASKETLDGFLSHSDFLSLFIEELALDAKEK